MVEAACPSYEGSVNNYPRPGRPLVGVFLGDRGGPGTEKDLHSKR